MKQQVTCQKNKSAQQDKTMKQKQLMQLSSYSVRNAHPTEKQQGKEKLKHWPSIPHVPTPISTKYEGWSQDIWFQQSFFFEFFPNTTCTTASGMASRGQPERITTSSGSRGWRRSEQRLWRRWRRSPLHASCWSPASPSPATWNRNKWMLSFSNWQEKAVRTTEFLNGATSLSTCPQGDSNCSSCSSWCNSLALLQFLGFTR